MSDPADIQRLVGDVIRLGVIEAVDRANATCTARIGDLVTPELPWLAQRAGGTCCWSPPTVGEQCVVLCPEGDTLAGLVLLGLFSAAHPAPAAADKLDLIAFADGALISYDAGAHALRAILPAGGTLVVDAPGGITFRSDVTVQGRITASDDVIGGGISLKSHRHGQVQSGGAQSGPPA